MPIALPVAVATTICRGGKCFKIPKDWEKVKCRAGGRRLRTACNTVSPADRERFRQGQVAPWLITDRVGDFQAAWGLKEDGNIESVKALAPSLGTAELADLHLNNVVPYCLGFEAGRHTCHPGEPPGRDFYDLAREQFRDEIRSGKFPWKHSPRGGNGGDPTSPQPGDNRRLTPEEAKDATSRVARGVLILGIAALFALGR